MKLEEMTVALRPRKPWESGDLGCEMVRRDWGRVLLLWAVTVFPLWAVLGALCHRSMILLLFMVWWLKPLYDRVILHHLSMATFGSRPTVGAVLRALPKLWWKHAFSALVTRRLSFKRSFAMPVFQLEGVQGKRLRQRMNVLANFGSSSGGALTWSFYKLEAVIAIGSCFLMYWLIPEGDRAGTDGLWNEFWAAMQSERIGDARLILEQSAGWIIPAYLLAVTLIEPFYVGAGFALYLNCRTRLEGWDVELAFRRLASRLRGLLSQAALLALAVCGLGLTSAKAQDDAEKEERRVLVERLLQRGKESTAEAEEKPLSLGDSEAKESAKSILEHPDFTIHKVKEKVPVRQSRNRTSSGDWNLPGIEAFRVLAGLLLWLLAAGAVGFVAYLLYQNRHIFARGPRAERASATTSARVVMGMEITPESLPSDVVAAAANAWNQGQARQALSLLYRGGLLWLVQSGHAPIVESDTEDDCLGHARRLADSSASNYFARLTDAWVQTAYAEKPPSQGEFSRLCQLWPFRRNAGGAA